MPNNKNNKSPTPLKKKASANKSHQKNDIYSGFDSDDDLAEDYISKVIPSLKIEEINDSDREDYDEVLREKDHHKGHHHHFHPKNNEKDNYYFELPLSFGQLKLELPKHFSSQDKTLLNNYLQFLKDNYFK